jgi:WXG100 family type VII secretion target
MANVSVTYEEMRAAGNQLTSGKGEINDKLTRLQSLIEGLVGQGFVTDTASKQFQESYNQFTDGATKMMEGLSGMSNYLNSAANTFEEADQSLAKALNG